MSLSYLDYLETISKEALFPRRKTMEDRAIYGGAASTAEVIGASPVPPNKYGYAPNPFEQAVAAAKPPTGLLENIEGRLGAIHAQLAHHAGVLEDITVRLFGQEPEKDGAAGQLHPVSSGALGDIDGQLVDVLKVLAHIDRIAGRFSRL